MKILYFTQLLGMALGLSARRVGRAGESLRLRRELLRARGLGDDWQRWHPSDADDRPGDAADAAIDARARCGAARRLRPCRCAAGDRRGDAGALARGARADAPTRARVEGFRLLALHRQGAQGDPSFNACRETCRELVYHHNLVRARAGPSRAARRAPPRRDGRAPSRALHRRQARGGGARRILLLLAPVAGSAMRQPGNRQG